MAMVSKNGFPSEALIYEAIQKEEGHLNASGVLCTYTGKHTGRSPDAKYFVKDSITRDVIDWEKMCVRIPESRCTDLQYIYDTCTSIDYKEMQNTK